MIEKGSRKFRQNQIKEVWQQLETSEDRKRREEEKLLQTTLAESKLAVRVVNALETRGIFTVGELLRESKSSLISITNFGETTLNQVAKIICELGLSDRVSKTDWLL